MELNGGVARFIFHPSRPAEPGKPCRLPDVRDDSCCGCLGWCNKWAIAVGWRKSSD